MRGDGPGFPLPIKAVFRLPPPFADLTMLARPTATDRIALANKSQLSTIASIIGSQENGLPACPREWGAVGTSTREDSARDPIRNAC
jgi:hypothetical protein